MPNGRRSGLVREGAAKLSDNASPERPSSRTSSPLPLGQEAVLILPNGRRSGLVREGAAKLSDNASPERPSSRTSSLLPLGQEAVFDSAQRA
ncbi:hypothetical protein B0A90_22990 [Pseudomonas syringae]|nr:hypothetical protein B1F67_00125 [Pseudomonas syringae]RXU08209.1 hypothetical protein B1F68_07420 [Pseudomonas syringae]RXU16418.1 hypothetical protein BXU05_03935 [Pseudomonas syringae]RXU32580.1 hypothetical protein B0A90_22990 [Pseudomonas syringae]RXU35347.1 hypothetical protein B0A93_11995 [Pseudomonas syringae]